MSEDIPSTEKMPLPKWFTIAAVLALIWNLLGVMAFVGQVTMTEEMMSQLPQAEQELYATTPMWATAAFAVAVFAGALASLALLMKRSFAYPIFVLSFIAVLIQMFHAYFIANSFAVFGPGGMIMPIMVVVVAFMLIRFSVKGINNKWFK